MCFYFCLYFTLLKGHVAKLREYIPAIRIFLYQITLRGGLLPELLIAYLGISETSQTLSPAFGCQA
jgi:hypothetical protein